jgi:hypothetical protein
MTEPTACCGRCSQTIEDTPIGVSVEVARCTKPTPSCVSARNVRHPCPDGWSGAGGARFPQADGAGNQGCRRSAPASETSIPSGPAAASAEQNSPSQHRPAHPLGCGQRPCRDDGDQIRELAIRIGMGATSRSQGMASGCAAWCKGTSTLIEPAATRRC